MGAPDPIEGRVRHLDEMGVRVLVATLVLGLVRQEDVHDGTLVALRGVELQHGQAGLGVPAQGRGLLVHDQQIQPYAVHFLYPRRVLVQAAPKGGPPGLGRVEALGPQPVQTHARGFGVWLGYGGDFALESQGLLDAGEQAEVVLALRRVEAHAGKGWGLGCQAAPDPHNGFHRRVKDTEGDVGVEGDPVLGVGPVRAAELEGPGHLVGELGHVGGLARGIVAVDAHRDRARGDGRVEIGPEELGVGGVVRVLTVAHVLGQGPHEGQHLALVLDGGAHHGPVQVHDLLTGVGEVGGRGREAYVVDGLHLPARAAPRGPRRVGEYVAQFEPVLLADLVTHAGVGQYGLRR